jgi:hypothetical protein
MRWEVLKQNLRLPLFGRPTAIRQIARTRARMEHMEVNMRIATVMLALGACARLLPHPWNFTPIMAIGLYAGAKSTKFRLGVLATLGALFLSDALIGFYRGMWYVYAASLIPVLISTLLRRKQSVPAIASAAFASSLSFFLITNFMVWATGHMYPHSAAGLASCYIAGIPFYRNQLLGDAFYTLALFGGDVLIRRVVLPVPQVA